MIKKHINIHFNISLLIRHWLAICFLLLLVAKPIVQNHLVLEDVKYKLIETPENESLLDGKTPLDFEDEVKHYCSNFNTLESFTKAELINFCNPKAYLNYKLDILLRPPRI